MAPLAHANSTFGRKLSTPIPYFGAIFVRAVGFKNRIGVSFLKLSMEDKTQSTIFRFPLVLNTDIL
jgi:hypothetical protein